MPGRLRDASWWSALLTLPVALQHAHGLLNAQERPSSPPVVQEARQPLGVMLAETWQPGHAIRGWWMSEKLDGIRAFWDGADLRTRSGLRLAAPPWFTKGLPEWPLDGELWVGRGQFAQTLSIVRDSVPGPEWRQVRFAVFDAPEVPGDLEARQAFLKQLPLPEQAFRVPQQRVADEATLQEELERVVQSGGEGLVLRRPHSLYVSGRSSDWLKVKPYTEAEAVVLRHHPGKGRNVGRLGSLEVRMDDGRTFRVGTGFSDAEREAPPPLGSRIQLRYSGTTRTGLPRFPVFLRLQEEL